MPPSRHPQVTPAPAPEEEAMRPLTILIPYCTVALLVALPARPAPAAIVTISRSVGPEDLTHQRRVIDDLSPLPGVTFQDTLSTGAPAVTVSGGDTVVFELGLRDPARFAVSPNVASDVFTQPGSVSVHLDLLSSAAATSVQRHVFVATPPSLDDPQNVATPVSTLVDPAYWADIFTGAVTEAHVAGWFPGAAFFVDPDQPGLFSGFRGSFLVPAEMPTTTFDRNVSFSVVAAMRGRDPPPPLLYTTVVPEPAGAAWLFLAAILPLGRRAARRAGIARGHSRV
jgi:hypothetical protein